MKIFACIRIIEFLNILLNKFNRDYDFQLISLIKRPKLKDKVLSLIMLLFSITLNIVSFWSYIISISIALNDQNNFIYAIFIKLNFKGMKKSKNKFKKGKILANMLNEIYDRFFVVTCVILVILQNYYDNKLNSHNCMDYLQKVLFLITSEVIFDWLRNIIIFKISDFKPNFIKTITYEICFYHDKLKYNCHNRNGACDKFSSEVLSNYVKSLDKISLEYISKSNFDRFSDILDYDDILCLVLQNNIIIYSIMVS